MIIPSRILYNIGKMENENASFSCILLKSWHYIQQRKIYILNLNSLFKYQTSRTTSCTWVEIKNHNFSSHETVFHALSFGTITFSHAIKIETKTAKKIIIKEYLFIERALINYSYMYNTFEVKIFFVYDFCFTHNTINNSAVYVIFSIK